MSLEFIEFSLEDNDEIGGISRLGETSRYKKVGENMDNKYFNYGIFKKKLNEVVDYKVEERDKDGIKQLKVINSPQSFAFISFSLDGNQEVKINLDYSSYSDEWFIDDLERVVNDIIKEMKK